MCKEFFFCVQPYIYINYGSFFFCFDLVSIGILDFNSIVISFFINLLSCIKSVGLTIALAMPIGANIYMKTNKSRLHTLASHSFKLDHNINQLNQLWFIDLLINSWRCGEKYKIMHSSTQNYLYCAGMSSWTKWSLLIIALFRPFASILRSMSLT